MALPLRILDTRAGPPFLFRACLVGAGAAIPIVAFFVDLLIAKPGHVVGRDFAGFWAAARLTTEGHPSLAYNSEAITATLQPLAQHISEPFVYPPSALLILSPFGLLPYWASLIAWTCIGGTLFALAAKPFVDFRAVLTLLTPAALLNAWDGQFGFVFGALWLCTFRLQHTWPGAAAGVATFKPHLALMLLPRLARSPYALVIAAVVAGALALFTRALWLPFLAAVQAQAAFVSAADKSSFFLRMMPGPLVTYGMNWVAWFFFAAAAIGVLVRYRCTGVFALATASFLILPYALNYDMTVANLGCMVALWRTWPTLSLWQRVVLSGGYLAPVLTFIVPFVVPPILLGVLVIQASHRSSDAADTIDGGECDF